MTELKPQNSKSHESATEHVTGRAVYTDEQRPPQGMLSVYPVTSPHAYAHIRQIDVSAAYAVAGCVTVLTAEDVPGQNNTGVIVPDEPLFPTASVSYWGQAIVWTVGETEEAARLAAAKVVVEYEPLEPIVTIKQAIAANSFHNQPQWVSRGNLETGWQAADAMLEGEIEMNGQDHFYLETQTSWVIPNGEGDYQVYASTQHPSETQVIVGRVLGISVNRIVVTCLRMGGAFGGKESQANPYTAVAAIAAHKTKRPVRVKLHRHHDMILTGKRHGFLGQYKVGFTSAGKMTGLEVDLYADGGWSLDLSPPVLMRAMLHVDNAYYLPHVTVRGQIARTHKVSNTAFRGFGGPQGMIVIEEVIDRIARSLNLPPDVVRERNFYHISEVNQTHTSEANIDETYTSETNTSETHTSETHTSETHASETNTTHYGQEIYDNRIARTWSEVKANADFAARQVAIAEFNRTHPYRKRGLAITPVKFGISFNKVMYNQAGALVLIYADGSIQLNHGGTEMGQGLHTKMLQVAARTLGVSIDRVRMMPTSTDKVPNTSATAASSGSDLNGQAVKDACELLKSRLAPVAAKLLNLDSGADFVFEADWVYCRTYPSARVAFEQVVWQAYSDRISLSATGFYRTPNIHWDPVSGKGRPFYYFAYGAAVSEVEVDGFTGTFKLRQVDIVHDVGESLNPLIDLGQIEGGFVQGMGWLTMEELIWDEQGRLRTFAPSTYKIPTISEIPEQFNIHLLERAAQDGVIYGSKAVGEPPFMLAMSVREAIRSAVGAFGQSDFVPLAAPATPEATLKAIQYVRDQTPTAVPMA